MRNRAPRWLLLGLLAVCGSAAAAAPDMSTGAPVRLIESTPSTTRFDVAVPEARIVPVSADRPAGVARLALDGWDALGAAGEPGLPSRVVIVAVPPIGTVHVSAEAFDATVRENVELAAVPWVPRGTTAPDAAALEGARVAPVAGTRARLLDVSWMRDQRVARIEVNPAEYVPESRRLTTWARVAVRVDVDGAGPPDILRAGGGRVGEPLGTAFDEATASPAARGAEALYRETLVNYEQGAAWRQTRRARLAAKLDAKLDATLDAKLDALGPNASLDLLAVSDTSVFVGRRWLKIAIPRTGFYRLPFSQFRRFVPFNDDTTTALDSLRLFTWSGSSVLPEADYCDTCGYREVSIGLVDNGDGKLNQNEDAIVFYALGPSDWADRFDPSQPDTVFVNNPHATRNVYYLGVGTPALPIGGTPKRITTRSGAVNVDGDETTPANFPSRVHFEQDIIYAPDAWPGSSTMVWDKFMWARLEKEKIFSAAADAPQADENQPGRLRARLWSFYVQFCLSPRQVIDVTWNQTPVGSFGWTGFNGYSLDAPVPSVRKLANALQITTTTLSCNNLVGVSWVDLFYARKFVPVNDALEFRPPAGGGHFIYRAGPFSLAAPPRVFDLANPLAPVEITGLQYTTTTDGHELALESVDDGRQRYTAVADSAMLRVGVADLGSAAGTSLDNLRSATQRADYVVIYYDDFQAAADTLTTWRRSHDGFRTKAVPISAIYDQFSGGRTDPTAIRNFLHAAFNNWALQPLYVTFMGDASYDFKNLQGKALVGQPGSPLPTYENGFESTSQRQFTTDDWLLNVDNPFVVVPDFLGGRLPVPSAAIAMDVVRNKVLRYDRTPPLGLYRARVMLIADDNEQGALDDPLHWGHLAQTTQLDTLNTPSALDRVYIYLHLYPDGSADTKPAAKADIIGTLNGDGVALVNYVGHGSPFKLSDEGVLLDTDAGVLTNAQKLPLFVAASCDVGRFSDPAVASLGEQLLLRANGGAIGVVSATDLAFSGENAALNRTMFDRLFSRSANGHYSGAVMSALAAAKSGSVNSQKYQLMGDAALHLNLPEQWVDVTLKDGQGRDTTALAQGHRMTFTGRVLDRPGGTPLTLDGTADVLVEDSAPLLQAPPCTINGIICQQPYFRYKAGPIYRGTVAVHGGQFTGDFVVPLEARPGRQARIRAYFATPAGAAPVDGIGDQRLRVATDATDLTDDTGPSIRLSFADGATRVAPNARLRIELDDPSGILITGHTRQNSIIVTIDGNTTTRVDVTSSFAYAEGSSRAGLATFDLPNLPDGAHRLSVSAADNLAAGLTAGQHRSQASIEFEVIQVPPLKLRSAYLFPNPTVSGGPSSGGRFVADIEGGPAEVVLRLYTAAGKLIRVLHASGVNGQLQLAWDGMDDEGYALANGVYLFRIQAKSSALNGSDPTTHKAHLEGRIVIVNP